MMLLDTLVRGKALVLSKFQRVQLVVHAGAKAFLRTVLSSFGLDPRGVTRQDIGLLRGKWSS